MIPNNMLLEKCEFHMWMVKILGKWFKGPLIYEGKATQVTIKRTHEMLGWVMDQQKLWKKKAYDIEEDDVDLEGIGTFVEQDLDFNKFFS